MESNKYFLMCSKSTRQFFPEIDKFFQVAGKLTPDILKYENSYENVIAVGGGTVMDAAKIICSRNLICYPTTAAGSCTTSHSVVWNEDNKLSIPGILPSQVIVEPNFLRDIPSRILFETKVDVVSHCFDSKYSILCTKESEKMIGECLEMLSAPNLSNEELIAAGNLGGKIIQITPTTILHSLSYPLTGRYGLTHGQSLSLFLPYLCKYKDFPLERYFPLQFFQEDQRDYEMGWVLHEALKYDKIYNFKTKDPMGMNLLTTILKEE